MSDINKSDIPDEGPASQPLPPTGQSLGERAVGVGDMPAMMNLFSWGAFLMMPLWGIVYGSGVVVRWWLIAQLVPLVIGMVTAGVRDYSAAMGSVAVSLVITTAIKLWVGMNANGWTWRREQARLKLLAGSTPRFSIAEFLARQRKWIAVGLGFVVFSMMGLVVSLTSTDPQLTRFRKEWGISQTSVAVSLFWTVAELALAFWLATQMKKGSGPVARKDGGGE